MNFEIEVVRFYDWLETNSVGTSCIVLWHALLHTWRKAEYPVEFAVAISVLEAKTGLKRDAIYNARNKLKQAGRIEWIERKGNQSALYKFVSFNPTQTPTQKPSVGLTDTHSHTNPTQTPTQATTIINNNNDLYTNIDDDVVNNVSEKPTQTPTQKPSVGLTDTHSHTNPTQNISNVESSEDLRIVQRYLEQKIGLISPTAFVKLREFLEQGLEVALINAVIDSAIDLGKCNWRYIEVILNDCTIKNIRSLEQFNAKEQRFREEKQNRDKSQGSPTKKNRFCNYQSREIDYAQLEQQEREYLMSTAARGVNGTPDTGMQKARGGDSDGRFSQQRSHDNHVG